MFAVEKGTNRSRDWVETMHVEEVVDADFSEYLDIEAGWNRLGKFFGFEIANFTCIVRSNPN
ncbi:hypothetical protein DSM3645_15305 [Blastopirellula marina DSM 3645]|uniref:Uncharacterized protein n=1 Tax=Blastopirellula marina DSM 3645 TaxID=314230 RepID=A3ZZ18_9BACT|nr:hypothetical protein DSM3645_15305 [Blastopirellula marina DSM 3645]